VANAQPVSPVGDWDFVITGSQQGVGFLHFESDGTIHGWEVVTHRQTIPSSDQSDLRGNTGGRGGSTSGTNSIFIFIGYTSVTGSWAVATSGKVFGNLSADEVSFVSGYSFTGVPHTGKFVLNATESPNPTSLDHNVRHTIWSGVPLAASAPLGVVPPTVADLSGTWLAQGTVTTFTTNSLSASESFTETLTLKSLTGGLPSDGWFTNLVGLAASPFAAQSYMITGTGPGYTNFGLALQSSKKRLSMFLREGDFSSDATSLRVVEGPLNTRNATNFNATAGGTDDNSAIVKYRLRRYVLD